MVVAGLLAVGVVVGGMGFWSWWTGEGLLPFERGAVFFRERVGSPVVRFFKGVDGVIEMGRLEQELEEAKVRLAELEWIELENVRLREALGFVEECEGALPGRGRLVAARVVSRGGGSGWWREVKLGQGSDAGIREEDAVVTSAGLVGRVKKGSVTARSCAVMLVSDGNSRIGVELQEDGAGARRGVLVGGEGRWDGEGMRFVHGANELELRHIGGSWEPAAGTRVVTSGLVDGGLPRGILVGTVSGGGRVSGGVAFEAKVVPAAGLRDLDVVFVVVGGGR